MKLIPAKFSGQQSRSLTNRTVLLIQGVVFIAVLAGSLQFGQAQSKPAVGSEQSAQRILVKMQPALAQQIETQLPAKGPIAAMVIKPGQAASRAVQSFLTRYSPSQLRPLYPEIIRARQQKGWTDTDFANHLRQQFPRRSARQTSTLPVPEISRTYVLEFPGATAQQIPALVQQLQADPDVELAEPDKFVKTTQATLPPNDPFLSSSGTWGQSYKDLWGHYKVDAPDAWNTVQGDGIVVAVVDTGIDYNHPDIAANVWINAKESAGISGIDDDGNGFIDDVRGWDFIGSSCFAPTQSNDPIDHFGHGTHVAGTIAAVGNNGIGIIGIAWHAQVMAVKGLDDGGCGLESTLAPAIQYAANNGADVINASWGGEGTSQVIEQAVQFAYGVGVVFVAAAGNSNEDAVNFFPANSPEAITVAASDAFDNFAFFSNFGSKIDVTAPGVDILSLRAAGSFLGQLVETDYMRLSGTSMAAPHVAGTTALILSQHPTYTPEDVRQVLRTSATSTGTPGWDPQFGYGIVNANAALAVPAVLEAHISAPAGGALVNSPVTITGIAQGATFDHYVLEFGSGIAPTVWTQLNSSTTAVSSPGGTLGTFDPGLVPDGTYTVRLTVFDNAAHTFSDRLELVVDYVSIISPFPPQVPVTATELKPGVQIPISGKATGASFTNFQLQWAEGINPATGWRSTGITLSGGGTAPVVNGTLGTWDTTGIATADYYTIRLLVNNAGFTSQAETLIYLEPDLLSPNWPQALIQAPDFQSGIVPVADASGNITLTLVNSMHLGSPLPSDLLRFSPQGVPLGQTQLTFGTHFNPGAADIDGNPGQETVVSDEGNGIVMFRSDSTSFAFQPPPALGSISFADSQVVLANLEQNSQLDVVALGNQFATSTAYLFAWRRDGSLLNANFPITIPDLNISLADGANQTARVVVGDINGDGAPEFVVLEGLSSSTFGLAVFANDGTPLATSPAFSGLPTGIALADLDHNGKLETLLSMFDSSQNQQMLHVFQPDGSERPGWPVTLTPGGGADPTPIVVGDLNRDGTEEIVAMPTNIGLFVFEPDGSPFPGAWPQGTVGGTLALADIDGDGFPEILLTEYSVPTAPAPLLQSTSAIKPGAEKATVRTESTPEGNSVRLVTSTAGTSSLGGTLYISPTLVALHHDGTVARTWTILGVQGNQPYITPVITVGDFNQDGITDIAFSDFNVLGPLNGGLLQPGEATVLSTGAPFNAANNDWPMIYQSTLNNPVLVRSITLALTSPVAGSSVGGTTAVTASTAGPVASLQFTLDGANLGSPVTAPPFTVQWDTTTATVGAHKLSAIATDGTGRPIAAAPISVNVIHGTNSSVALALTAGSNPSTYGDSLTFTATVTPSNATGVATFFDGTTAISGLVLVNNGTASFSTSSLSKGPHNITAQYSGDLTFLGSTSTVTAQNVNPAALSITANNASRAFGLTNPAFSGSVTGAVNSDTFTETFATTAMASSPVGNYSIVPTVIGAALGNYTVTPSNGTLTVLKASTAAALSSSNTSVNAGSTVIFSASVASATSGTPTGSIQFLDGTTVLGSSPLDAQGNAALTTNALAGGTHTMTALYIGDSNFNGSNSATVVQNIMDFSEAASPSSATIKAGGSATFTFTITPEGGFNQVMSFACTGLPAEAQCTFNPPSITPNGAPVTSTLTITTTAASAVLPEPSIPNNNLPLYAFLGSALAAMTGMALRGLKFRKTRLVLGTVVLCVMAALASCGGSGGTPIVNHNPGTPLGTSQITVTTSSRGLTHASSITLTVN